MADFASADPDAIEQLIKTDGERFEANDQLFAYRRDLCRAILLVPVMYLDATREEFFNGRTLEGEEQLEIGFVVILRGWPRL